MPFPDDDEPMTGPWGDRVRYLETGEAVTPGRLIVPNDAVDFARETISGVADFQPVDDVTKRFGARQHTLLLADEDTDLDSAIGMLNAANITGQPSHVLFACNVGPYAGEAAASTEYGLDCNGEPHPAGGKPGHALASPVYANPVYANPVYANPYRSTGERESTARPAEPMPTWEDVVVQNSELPVNVVILDTGMAKAEFQPALFQGMVGVDEPDKDVNSRLDPAAGHGTFIAGLIRGLAPTASLKSVRVLGNFGDGDESLIAYQIDQLADGEDGVDLLNLSFGGYSASAMAPLTAAIENLQQTKGTVVVASAGNDATCRQMWPAVLEEVVAVGALDAAGNPAAFTNFGPWVRACTHGADVVSAFFTSAPGTDIAEWATWSGTSFAAPIVTGMIARTMLEQGIDAHTAWAALEAGAAAHVGLLGVRIELPPQV